MSKSTKKKSVDFTTFSVHPETFRIIGYLNFWTMAVVSVTITLLTVHPNPFIQSPIVSTFGYANICVSWDTGPALIFASIFYIIIDFSIIFHVFLTWLRVWRDFHQGQITERFFKFVTVMTIIEAPLIAIFRLCFVIRAEEDIVGHTVGFLCLEVALAVDAFKSYLYFIIREHIDKRDTRMWFGLVYLVALIVTTVCKLTFTIAILSGNPIWDTESAISVNVGQFLDISWMLQAAVMPLGFAIYLRRATPRITFHFFSTDDM